VISQGLGVDPDSLPTALRDFEMGRPPSYFLKTLPLTGLARRALEELAAAPYGGRFAGVHASLRTVDLVCALLDALIGAEQPGPPRLSPRDERVLEGIRSYLATCYTSPPTLIELARMAGMNRTKLTQTFRTVYQETVSEYCLRLRMAEARRLLLDGETAGRVAAAVGYEHQSSFSQAYKAYFGFAPIASRRG
jgi:AraC-like DNA-binding protein